MTTSVLAATTIPRFIVIKSNYFSDKGYTYYKEGGSVLVGEESVFSTLVKIEAERATSNSKYVHLRFCYTNRYWARKANDKWIVAESDQPEEDTSNPSCTLFEAVKADGDKEGVFYLSHVESGGRLLIDGPTMAFYVDESPGDEQGYLTFVDWDSIVQLPAHVAFKGDNDKYLANMLIFFLFISDDPNTKESGLTVELRADGYVRINSDSSGVFWTIFENDSSIQAMSPAKDDAFSHFWPVKIDDNTIALRNESNNLFCQRSDSGSLSASAPTIRKQAILQVQELVLERKIYNVTYQMEYARIFNEVPYLAGSSTLVNDKDEEASMGVEISYQDEKSYTFSRSLSLTAGVSASIEAGLPFIEKATITVTYEINGTFQWDTTTTTTTTVTATGTIPIPGKTTAIIDYVGTRGTCNIPYSYTQQDKSSTDGQNIYTDLVDGIYTGVSYYNFNFHVRSTQPL